MSKSAHTVMVVAYDGLCTFEFGVAVEAFGLPRPEWSDWYNFAVIACEDGDISAVGGLVVVPQHKGVRLLLNADTIIVPGWRDVGETPPEPLLAVLREAVASGKRIISLCSGAFVLAAAGLLDDKSATTHWRYAKRLQRTYPRVRVQADILYTEDQRIFTSAGSAAAIDLCLHIIRKDHGARVGNAVARRLVVPPHREGGQKQFIESPLGEEGSPWLSDLVGWLRGNLSAPVSVTDMASRVHMSPRSFARHVGALLGMSPARWLASLRLNAAKELLETSTLSLEEIARLCGFSNAALLRNHFRRSVGRTPSAYRQSFDRSGHAVQEGANA